MSIPLSSPDITEVEIAAVTDVLRSSRLSLGPKMLEFEASMAAYTGSAHAVAVSSGTAGLHLCVRVLGLAEGDEVIVPSFTFIAAANAIRYERATPVFVDIDARSLNASAADIERAITPRTRAILAVHTFGRPAEMDAILEIARRHRLFVIEDACEALGAEVSGRKTGTMGDLGVFAFYPNKQITTGEGGMIVTERADLTDRLRALRNQGRGAEGAWLQHTELGYNYRLSEMQCALGIAQMERLESILSRRNSIAQIYGERLAGVETLILPESHLPQDRISWFVYVVRLSEEFTAQDRDRIAEFMVREGIGCSRYFAPIHMQPAYSAWRTVRPLPVTESNAARTLALPFFNQITENQLATVCAVLREAIEMNSRHDRVAGSHSQLDIQESITEVTE